MRITAARCRVSISAVPARIPAAASPVRRGTTRRRSSAPISGARADRESRATKNPGSCDPGFSIDCLWQRLRHLHFFSLHAFLALRGDEAYLLTLGQRLEARALDRTEMYEDVRAAFRRDEAEALRIVEPLDGTVLTFSHLSNSS